MTKHRPPLSFDAGMARIAGLLPNGWKDMAEATGRSQGHLRNCGDPDKREHLSIDDALALDVAFMEAGGLGAPLHEAYTAQLKARFAHRFADALELARLAAEVIREGGEAHAALVLAARPGASASDRAVSLREVEEALVALTRAHKFLLDHPHTGPPG